MIDGRAIAREIIDALKIRTRPDRVLAAVLVGEDPASRAFLVQKHKIAEQLGIPFRLHEFPADIGATALRGEVSRISAQARTGGIVVQLPLPEPLSRQPILNAIRYRQDVECLTSRMTGDFYHGRSPVLPPAVAAMRECLHRAGGEDHLSAQRVAVIGTGVLVGRPIVNWLLGRAAEVCAFDIRSTDLRERLNAFDVVISGAGSAHLFAAADLRENAIVIDFGYEDGKGDFDATGADERRIVYTPMPGGTGPVVIATLFENFYVLNAEYATPLPESFS
jgi:methylenetetrahydrofolate dehydrogenase (NADP+)/methenyltetrahydrofolate cyclohydrolase